jgi:hypothetical protein
MLEIYYFEINEKSALQFPLAIKLTLGSRNQNQGTDLRPHLALVRCHLIALASGKHTSVIGKIYLEIECSCY